jgi:aminopeptidase-like protein
MYGSSSAITIGSEDRQDVGRYLYGLLAELYPICRSLTGPGVRETLRIVQRELPGLTVHEVPTGTVVFDWVVPDEWTFRCAYLLDPDGRKIIDVQNQNLHVVGYSMPVDITLSLDELQEHLHSLPDQPDAVPYVTSYYERRWGLCLTHRQRQGLKPGRYRVVIDSTLAPGHLTYGEWRLAGETDQEIFLSTYICHPSMANNELSGPVVATALARWLASAPRRYSYRIVFIPETIGSITYLSRNLDDLKSRVVAGFVVTCVGDDRAYSYIPSRKGLTLADRAALHALTHRAPGFIHYSFQNRVSDERQYNWPGVDLPVCVVTRSRPGSYPEYHTSLDNLQLVTPTGLAGGFCILQTILQCLEENRVFKSTTLCEPNLGRRGLYPTLYQRNKPRKVHLMRHILIHADGEKDLLAIAQLLGEPVWEMAEIVKELTEEGLLIPVPGLAPATRPPNQEISPIS